METRVREKRKLITNLFRLKIVWISGLLTGTCLVFGILHNIEYEVICVSELGDPHENVFGICPEQQRAYLSLKTESGYRHFTVVSLFLMIVLIPMCFILYFIFHLVYK